MAKCKKTKKLKEFCAIEKVQCTRYRYIRAHSIKEVEKILEDIDRLNEAEFDFEEYENSEELISIDEIKPQRT